jgi:F0F1-type ATP synthase assembly protein I
MLGALPYFWFKFVFMEPGQPDKKSILIPSSYRWIENGHVLLWLLKDTFWAMEFRAGALFMVLPTISVAVYILWRSRHSRQDYFHNAAVCLWITGNSVWMAGEFFKHEMRPVAVVIFSVGLIILALYYIFFFAKDKEREAAIE